MLIQLLTNQYPGMRLWLSQRLSSLVMAFYMLVLLIMILITQPAGFVGWHAFFAPIWFRIATLIFFVCLLMHAWLGVADVLKDYVFNKTLRGYMQILVDILLLTYLVWAAMILWNI